LVLFFVSEDARRCVDLIFKKGENLLPGHKKLKDMCVWVKVNALLWNKTFTLKRSLEINDTKFFFCTCNAFKKKTPAPGGSVIKNVAYKFYTCGFLSF